MKAPIALRIAAELIDRGADLPLQQALDLELAHLVEIFSTKDAYEGLTSLGRHGRCLRGSELIRHTSHSTTASRRDVSGSRVGTNSCAT